MATADEIALAEMTQDHEARIAALEQLAGVAKVAAARERIQARRGADDEASPREGEGEAKTEAKADPEPAPRASKK